VAFLQYVIFHLTLLSLAAGAGANVTLGIPRLREIIMTASRAIKTTTMSIPLDFSVTEKQAVKLARFFTKPPLLELLASQGGIKVVEILQGDAGNWQRAYIVTMNRHLAERIMEAFWVISSRHCHSCWQNFCSQACIFNETGAERIRCGRRCRRTFG
jgi:DNA-directed RNA polymerase I subunit RPA1